MDVFFPKTNVQNMNQLKCDHVGKYSITTPDFAEHITFLILKYVPDCRHIIDMTAGLGGNTINFANKIAKVSSIELDTKRYEFLNNNLMVYNITNVTTYNMCCFKWCDEHVNCEANVIFIDPPWGGKSYKYEQNICLSLDEYKLHEIPNIICKKIPKISMIVFKLPINYNITLFQDFNYKIHKLKKNVYTNVYTMQILCIFYDTKRDIH